MTVHEVQKVIIPEDYVIIETTYEQFRKYLKGVWNDACIFKTVTYPHKYYSFAPDFRRVMV